MEASDCNDNANDLNSIISPTTTQGKSRVFEEGEVMLFSNLFKDLFQGSQKIESKDVLQRLKGAALKTSYKNALSRKLLTRSEVFVQLTSGSGESKGEHS